jgi:hypothetical protein
VAHPAAWLGTRGSHDTPVYGFERIIDPPPLRVDVSRLLGEFSTAATTLADAWSAFLAPRTAEVVGELARDAQKAASVILPGPDWPDDPRLAAGPPPFHFPDHAWARIFYDAIVALRDGYPGERLAAALLPLYFGKVAALFLETRTADAEQADEAVERLAREFELAKPYLLRGWEATAPTVAASA